MKKARELLLIYPRLRYPSGDVPLGILYLAGKVRKELGIKPDIIDLAFFSKPLKALSELIRENRYSWIAISAMITMAKPAKSIARLIRKIQPEAKIILGGPHPTTLPERCAGEEFDFLVLGEGEESLVELLKKGSGERVLGVWFRKGSEWIKNPPRPALSDLDQLPFPAFDLIDLKKYMKLWFQLDTLGRPVLGTNIIASRGCPYRCSFCQPTLEKIFGKRLRKRSSENIIQELSWLKERFGIQGFVFVDDTILVDKTWCKDLAEKLINSQLGLVFGANVRAEQVDEDILRALYEAGLRKIYLGVEAYSDRVRNDILGKSLSREDIERAVNIARKSGIKVQGYFMIGAPTETRGEVKQTLLYARRLGLDDITINITTPLPATYLYEKYKSEISLSEEEFDYYRKWAFKPSELNQQWLRKEQILGYMAFYLRPKKFFKLLWQNLSPRMLARTGLKLKRVLG